MKDEGMKMRDISPLILLLSFILLLPSSFFLFQIGCHKKDNDLPDIKFEYKIAPDPPRTGLTTVTLKLADSAGEPINGAQISLEGNMSHAGMRPVFSKAREVSSGSYESVLEFTMKGDWIIIVHLTLPDGRKLQRQIVVNEVRSG
jgi:hypothetical protein